MSSSGREQRGTPASKRLGHGLSLSPWGQGRQGCGPAPVRLVSNKHRKNVKLPPTAKQNLDKSPSLQCTSVTFPSKPTTCVCACVWMSRNFDTKLSPPSLDNRNQPEKGVCTLLPPQKLGLPGKQKISVGGNVRVRGQGRIN